MVTYSHHNGITKIVNYSVFIFYGCFLLLVSCEKFLFSLEFFPRAVPDQRQCRPRFSISGSNLIEVLHGWTRVKKRGPSCEMPSVARRLVVRQSWQGAWYKRVYMWFLIIRSSRDVWIWWSQPTLPLSVWCAPQDCLSSSFLRLIPVLRCWVVCCGHRVGVLLVVGEGGG